jgi:hypothetical protein
LEPLGLAVPAGTGFAIAMGKFLARGLNTRSNANTVPTKLIDFKSLLYDVFSGSHRMDWGILPIFV